MAEIGEILVCDSLADSEQGKQCVVITGIGLSVDCELPTELGLKVQCEVLTESG